jgi:tetratricopeptide (TPR) repeat protein
MRRLLVPIRWDGASDGLRLKVAGAYLAAARTEVHRDRTEAALASFAEARRWAGPRPAPESELGIDSLILEQAFSAAARNDPRTMRLFLAQIPAAGAPVGLRRRMAEVYREARTSAARVRRPEADQRVLTQLVEQYPRNAGLRNDRGVAYALLGRRDEAAEEFQTAIRLDPTLPSPYLSLGTLYSASGQGKAAAGIYREAMRHACPKIPPEVCEFMGGEPARQPCFERDVEVCRLLGDEIKRLRLGHDTSPTP